jgi:undecaprenyl phosphate N,N'-diacetylbacillosamine 1-phosphate transferase
MYRKWFKRLFDLLLLVFIVPILSPFLAVLFLILVISNKGRIFYTQERVGLNGRIFRIFKFRTMQEVGDSNDREPEMTSVGKYLRMYSLNELPQLLNILKGELSFVGPRPLLPEYLGYYTQEEMKRHLVRPGITGLAQINGRNETTWEERFEFDLKYVKKISFILDLKILVLTIPFILTHRSLKQMKPLTEVRKVQDLSEQK